MQLVYLDHNATTPIKPEVRDAMLEVMSFPGNPSAVHKAGREARRLLENARAGILKKFNAGSRDVLVFTASATEANNMLLRGIEVEQILVSAIEHPSVLNALPQHIEKKIIPVLPSGVVDLIALDDMLAGNTKQTLISVMAANNETGVIQPVKEIAKIARKYGALFHTDAVQALGRMAVDIQEWQADFLTFSAHKIGGPQGVGCLIIANCNVVAPLLKGGNQEKNLRSGTENLAGIVGFAKAVELADDTKAQQLSVWRDKIETELKSAVPALSIFGSNAPRLPNTTMFALMGAPSEMQLISLDLAGICVSNGSACSSGTVKASHVLKAMGVDENEAASSLRVSLGWNTEEKDVDFFIQEWLKMYNRIKSRLTA